MQVVPQILPPFKIQHFSGDGMDKKYRSVFTRTRHFKRKIHFPGKGI